MDNPMIKELRQIREEHAKKFNYDLHAICEDLRSRHTENVERLASFGTSEQSAMVAEEPVSYGSKGKK